MVTTHKQTPAEARRAALQSEYAALYAVAGLTDALTERAGKSLSRLQRRGVGAGRQARENADELRTFVITLPEQIKNLPEATRSRIADLQRQANELKAQASGTYGQLAGRGKRVIDDAKGTAWDLSDRAERRAESVVATTGRTATETMMPRGAAKAAATRKAAAKKVPANKIASARKKTAAKK